MWQIPDANVLEGHATNIVELFYMSVDRTNVLKCRYSYDKAERFIDMACG